MDSAEPPPSPLRPILETALDAVVVMDSEGRVADWNEAAERTFGWSREEALGHNMADLIIPPQYREAHWRGLERYLRTGTGPVLRRRIEVSALHRDGREMPVELSISPVQLDGGLAFLGFLRDITDRHATQQLLEVRARDAELLFRVTALAGEAGSLEEALPACLRTICELTGWPVGHAFVTDDGEPDVLSATGVWHPAGPDRFDPLREATSGMVFRRGLGMPGRILATGEPEMVASPENDAAFLRSDVARLLGVRAAFGFPIKARGEVVAVLEFFSEEPLRPDPDLMLTVRTMGEQVGRVVERRRGEEALKVRSDEFRTLADNIPTLCWMAYADGHIFWYNRRWYEYTGASPQDQEGWGWESVHDPQVLPAVVERWRCSLETGEPFEMIFPLRGADGLFRPFLTRVVPIRDEAGRIVRWFGTNVDVTEQRRHEERLRLLVDELNHRVKNNLATVQSIATATARSVTSLEAYKQALNGRVAALASAHDLLTESAWEGAELEEVVRRTLAPYMGVAGPVTIAGPPVRLSPNAAVTVHMGLHEMATNAAKYGALSVESGRLDIEWRVLPGEPPRLQFDWRESGVPDVRPPSREGFGTRLIKAVGRELDARVEPRLGPDGMSFRWTAPASSKVMF